VAARAPSNRRALAKERRRQQLLDATIKCISKKGLGGLTLAEVAAEAGLSQGIVNLHFHSKDNLLKETLSFLAGEYDEAFTRTLDRHAPDAARTLLKLMQMDLSPAVCDRRKLAVWFAFWGEVKSVPTYQKICAARDNKYSEIVSELCERIVAEGGYEVDAQAIADGLSALTDGIWLSYLINPKSFDRNQSIRAVEAFLRALFPDHYPQRETSQ